MKVRTFAALAAAVASLVAVAAVRPVAAAPTSRWWVSLAFSNRELGAVVQGSGDEQGSYCELSIFTTSNGGTTWAPPSVLTHRASCGAGGSTDEMAITDDGTWLLGTPQGLFEGRVGLPGSRLVQVTRLVPSEPTDSVCSVAAAVNLVIAVLANGCGLRSVPVVLVSVDDGVTWTTSRDIPLGSVDEVNLVDATPPDSLEVADPSSAWLIGRAVQNSDGPLELARTIDSGRSWHISPLPCRTDRMDGLISAIGDDVVAVCLGGPSAGYGPMEVVTSTDGGANWTERCNNGPPGLLKAVGGCPAMGYPAMVASMGDRALVMAIGYPLGGVEVSLDGGRTWRLAVRSSATFLTLSQGSGVVWMLGLGPIGPGTRLAESTNGWSWQKVALP